MRQEVAEKRSSLVFETMKAAASGLKIPMSLLKQAKDMGCPAFRGSRVYGEELQVWIEENPVAEEEGDDKEALEKRKLKLQCQLLAIKVKADMGEYVAKSILEEYIPRMLAPAADILRKHLDAAKYNACVKELKNGFANILTPPAE